MILIYALVTLYAVLLVATVIIWSQIPEIDQSSAQPKVTVIIPVRNEAKYIGKTLRYILANTYLNFEIIVVNDHSVDDTVQKLLAIKDDRILLLNLTDVQGKKAAITKAIDVAQGELILCTDGDTYVGTHWIQSHVDTHIAGAKLAFGRVSYTNSWSSKFLNQELAALVAIGAMSIRLGKPGMINGCNYSFSKTAFLEVGGFSGNEIVPSGDDEFLLRKIHSRYQGAVVFLKTSKAMVETEPPKSFSDFFNQRRRWASKWKLHTDWFSKILAMSVFLFHLLVIYIFYMGVFEQSKVACVMLLVRMAAELLLIKSVNGKSTSILVFLLLQIIYPFYAVFFGIASTFGKYRWRGRTYQI